MGNAKSWAIGDMPEQKGRVFLITGGNTGLGLQSAKQLAKAGATVVVSCRTDEKGKKAVEDIKDFAGKDKKVEYIKCDLGDLDSVRQSRSEFEKLGLPLHVLMNNAGVMMCPFGTTKQGYETQFGVNHIGHFLLTTLFYPILKQSVTTENPGRIVNVSSAAHTWGPSEGIMFDNLLWEKEKGRAYSPKEAYGQSKFANIVFTQELAERVVAAGDPIYCNAIHPGVVKTDLARHMEDSYGSTVVGIMKKFLTSVEDGALTQLYASTCAETQGKYYVPTAKMKDTSGPKITKEMQGKLWQISEEMVSEKFNIVAKAATEEVVMPKETTAKAEEIGAIEPEQGAPMPDE